MRNYLFFTVVVLAELAISCTNTPWAGAKRGAPGNIYSDYQISGEEGTDTITCLFQYRAGGKGGTSLLLQEGSTVALDGEVLQPDSARMTGAYYEIQKPLSAFAGKHHIVFTDAEGKQFKEEFSFQPFTMLTSIGNTVKREDITLEFNGLQPVDTVRVLLIDTSFATKDINETETVHHGRLTISEAQLSNIKNGPVTLQIFKEEERPLHNSTKREGQLSITYGLRREFDLVE